MQRLVSLQGRRTLALLKMTESFFQAGTDGAGVWGVGSVRAESWTSTTLPIQRESVLSLAANDRMTFAGTDGNGVFRQFRDSREGEPGWRSTGLSGQKVSALATSGERVFAGTLGDGLWVSTDNGASWSKSGRGLPADASIHALASQGATLFAGTATGLWRSLDNGDKWARVHLGLPANTPVNAVLPDGANIFVGTGGGVLSSTNGGKTFKAFNEGLTNRRILALVKRNGRLFAGTKGGGIFMTSLGADGNQPPTAKSQTVTCDEDTSVSILLIGEGREDKPVNFKILTRPQNGNLIGDAPRLEYKPFPNFVGVDSFIFIAHDGKAASRIATVTINVNPVDDLLDLTIEGDENPVVGGFVALSVRGFDPDGGAVKVSAKSLPQGAVFEHLSAPSPDLVKWVPTAEGTYTFSFTATQDNGASLTKEFKVNVTSPRPVSGWSQVPLFIDKYAREILIAGGVDGETIYISAEGAGSDNSAVLLRSTDNGRNWTRIGDGLVSRTSFSIVSNGKALFVATHKNIFRSTDGGLKGSGIGLPEDGTGLSVAAQGDKTLAWRSRKLFLSLNAGESWSEVTGNLPVGLHDAPSTAIGAATVSGEALVVSLYTVPPASKGPLTFRSTNNGASWQTANNGLDGLSGVSRFIVDGDNLYGVMAMSTYHSGDHGASWRVTNPLFSSNRQGISPNIAAAARNGLLAVMYSGGSVSITRDNGGVWTEIERLTGEEITELAVGSSSLFAVTKSGKLFSRSIN